MRRRHERLSSVIAATIVCDGLLRSSSFRYFSFRLTSVWRMRFSLVVKSLLSSRERCLVRSASSRCTSANVISLNPVVSAGMDERVAKRLVCHSRSSAFLGGGLSDVKGTHDSAP